MKQPEAENHLTQTGKKELVIYYRPLWLVKAIFKSIMFKLTENSLFNFTENPFNYGVQKLPREIILSRMYFVCQWMMQT